MVSVRFQLFLSVGIDAESQPNELSELLDGHLEGCRPCIAKDVILIPVVVVHGVLPHVADGSFVSKFSNRS